MPINEPIKRNKLSLFKTQKVSNKPKSQITTLKDDCALFSRLYIACQSREGNLDDFFKHENHPYPPSLAKYGEMRSGTKTDLMDILEAYLYYPDTTPSVTANILDGAMLVQMLHPKGSITFQDYLNGIFLTYLSERIQNVSRLDIVWDRYVGNSLKSVTRGKRGHGSRRRVTTTNHIPSNWQSFLRVDENKIELFQFLAKNLLSFGRDGEEV